MFAFRMLLMLIPLVLLLYTGIVIGNHGINLLPVFFGDMLKLGWSGQFNLDFLFMLALSAVWTAWRNRFSRAGIILACLALFGGSLFLSIYLLVLTWKTNGDISRLLMGER